MYWATSFALRFLQRSESFWIDFHNCAHGGLRDKLTRRWSNKEWGQSLQLFCDKQHHHASWRPRVINNRLNCPTAEEAAYPWLFCERVANVVEDLAQSFGAVTLSTLHEQVSSRARPVLLGLNSLPFGGVGSVAGFLRVSLATWFTGMAGLKICWTGSFDDFSALSRRELQNSTT